MLAQISTIFPEVAVVVLALALQIAALFSRSQRLIANTAIILVAGIAFVMMHTNSLNISVFNDTFAISHERSIVKLLVLIFVISTIFLYQGYCVVSLEKLRMEFITLLLLSAAGIFIAISSQNFLILFCGMELQSLCGYTLAAMNVSNIKSSEAGLKYFVLGSLVSCITLIGISFIYGFSGSLQFSEVASALAGSNNSDIGVKVGIILMLSGVFFKLSASPFHVWAPDVYEGAPISAVGYFATATKIGALAVLMNIADFASHNLSIFTDLVRIIAICSMLIGSFGAIMQKNIKRLMAYSTILNIGYVLIGISVNSVQSNFAAMLYITIYSVSVFGFFSLLTSCFGKKVNNITLKDLGGIASTNKAIACAISMIMFSMIGIPPLAGFFGKYYIFYHAISHNEWLLAILGIATSVLASYYYLNIVKTMYFDAADKEQKTLQSNRGLFIINTASVGFTVFFAAIAPFYLIKLVV